MVIITKFSLYIFKYVKIKTIKGEFMLIGIGCDITNIKRFVDKSDDFVDKILSSNEKKIYIQKSGNQKAEFLAGRFCAKEAIIKALPQGDKLAMPSINIYYQNKKPVCIIPGFQIHISISHEKDFAISYVCIEQA